MQFNKVIAKYLAYKKANTKYTTFRSEESRIRLYIIPFFKDDKAPITSERQIEFKGYISQLNKAENYKRAIFLEFIMIECYGEKFLNISTKRVVKNFSKQKLIYTIWNYQQYGAFRKTQKGLARVLFDVLYYGGLRRGEAMALYPEDLKGNDRISITKNYSRRYITTPKTQSSNRIIELPKEIYNELKFYADLTPKGTRIFKNINYTTAQNLIKRGAKEANLPVITMHELRHSHITMLLYQKITPQGVANRVGHSNTNTLLNVYASYIQAEEKDIIKALESKIKATF